jgi:methionine-rich copper-binding protein CopC
MQSLTKRFLCAFAAVTLAGLAGAGPAVAHMGVESSNPSNGTQVAFAPSEMSITFSIDVDRDSAAAQLRYIGDVDAPISDANRRDVRTEPLTKLTGDGPGADVVFDLPYLPAGLYVVDWSVEEIDGHANSSMIVFKVTQAGAPSARNEFIFGFVITTVVVVAVMVRLRRTP